MGLQTIKNKLRKLDKINKEKQRDTIPILIKTVLTQEGLCKYRQCEKKDSCKYYRKMPKNPKIKEIAECLDNCIANAMKDGALPRVPSESWRSKHGTVAEPLDWVDDIN